VAGLRDIIVHQYFGLDPELTWDAASVHVPRLLDAARRLQASANLGTDDADGADVGEGEQRDD
jgi:uncharacterized protein with HEPN domain